MPFVLGTYRPYNRKPAASAELYAVICRQLGDMSRLSVSLISINVIVLVCNIAVLLVNDTD